MEKKEVFFALQGEATIDDKGRIKLPAIFRDELVRVYGENMCPLVATTFDNKEMRIWPEDEWNNMIRRIQNIIKENPGTEKAKEAEAFRYYGISNSERCNIDSNGRIVIPKSLRDKLKLTNKIKMLGMGEEIRVISEELIKEKEQNILNNYDFTNISY